MTLFCWFLLNPLSLKNLLSNPYNRGGVINEMSFGISNCITLVVKSKNFIPSKHYENPTFKFGMSH